MKREILPVLLSLFCASCLDACNIALPGENEETRREIEGLVASGKYEEAAEKLANAANRATVGDAFNMKLNEIILDIDSGQCALAIRKLHALRTPEQNTSDERWIYYFGAFARMCEADPEHVPSQEDISQALADLLVAESLGVPCRGQISNLLEKIHTPCDTFQSPLERAASTPANAIDYKPEEFFASGQTFTVCPQKSLWLSFEGRTLEEITITALFRRLKQRSFYLDDSSQLPYAQPRIRVYAKDSDGTPVQPPILDKALPIPEGAPEAIDYEARSLALPTFIAKAGYSQYYLELSTQYNGEVSTEITLKREIDCNVLDDELTWTDDLQPVDFEPEANKLYNRMILCPGRKDQLTTTLQPGQSVMIMLYSSGAKDITLNLQSGNNPPVPIHLREAIENPEYKHYYGAGVHYTSPQLENFTSRDNLGALFSPTLITFKYPLDVPARSSIFLEQDTDHPISYVFQYILSEDCKKERGKTKKLDIELPVSQDNQQRPLSTYRIGWLCENTTLEFNPIFKSQALTGQYLTAMTLLTSDHESPNDFICENDLRTDVPGTDDFLAEKGVYHQWKHRPVPCVKTKLLMRPITERSVLKLKTLDIPGFWTLLITPQTPNSQTDMSQHDKSNDSNNNENTQNNDSAKQNSNDTQPKDGRQEQNSDSQNSNNKSQSDGNERENDAKQSPSESQSSATGKGQGAQGGNSGQGTQKRTVIQSTDHYDSIRLNEILDNFENSRKIRPTQNMPLHESRDDEKNW